MTSAFISVHVHELRGGWHQVIALHPVTAVGSRGDPAGYMISTNLACLDMEAQCAHTGVMGIEGRGWRWGAVWEGGWEGFRRGMSAGRVSYAYEREREERRGRREEGEWVGESYRLGHESFHEQPDFPNRR